MLSNIFFSLPKTFLTNSPILVFAHTIIQTFNIQNFISVESCTHKVITPEDNKKHKMPDYADYTISLVFNFYLKHLIINSIFSKI